MERPKGNSKKATIYDIAAEAGMSASTVSVVLSGRWREYRVSEETADRIISLAQKHGYSVNLGARGLRLSRSGLCGMIVPHYRNRFFAGLAEAFENMSRARGLCPVVVSTHRNSKTERETVETLVAHQAEFLFVAGVQDPLEINRLCANADIRSINIDLPGKEAPSVISDNRSAARALTERMLQGFKAGKAVDFRFFGGNASDNATLERIEGVRDAFRARGTTVSDEVFDPCGYNPSEIAEAIHTRLQTGGKKLPAAIFANGITALEGLLILRNTRGLDLLTDSVIGCYDWDPFAANLPHDISFVRQDVDGLIAAGFDLLDGFKAGENPTVRVPAELRQSAASKSRISPAP